MKPRSFSLREGLLVCGPLVIVVLVGAFLSARQNERAAEQRRVGIKPLRLKVWNVQAMPVDAYDKRSGYNFLVRINVLVKGDMPVNWTATPRATWLSRVKSGQITCGKAQQPSRIINTVAPYRIGKVPHCNILGVGELPLSTGPREVALWVQCDARKPHSTLSLEIEAVQVDAKTHKPLGARVVAPVEKFELRPYDLHNDAANNWKRVGW